MSSNKSTTTELSEQDQLFIDCLYNQEVNPDFDPEVARMLAGLQDEPLQSIIGRLKAEYQSAVQNYFLSLAPAAAMKLHDIASGRSSSLNSDKIHKAATEILDRAGITKKEKQEVEITAHEGVLILPPIQYKQVPVQDE